jgi:DNA helicase INO80
LGKTVQSIAFLCHIAENYGVWGPFLIISPASTLHNWQQEMQRFVPDFNVVPYWGSPNERKILRQFWEQKDLHTKSASFHVVITSYQLVVTDYKYFNRIKWQYMVLDEAQAIKSSSSVRWKLLLGFNCRNRLLLSGTPIQNSMAELWALLHFIMPTLFDSHEEFNEWFSKDIESHAENKTGIDEKQISRLHMILKPFMLRRIKKDVENELSDKIEVMVYCPLTTRQKLLYMALKKKIRIEDLLNYTGRDDGNSADKNFTSSLMNLVMQFRKVCNHPELFERRDIKSPFSMKIKEFLLPRLVYNECWLSKPLPSKKHLLYNKFNIWKVENIQRSLFPNEDDDAGMNSTFSFIRFCDLSPNEIENLTLGGLLYFLLHCLSSEAKNKLLNYRKCLWNQPGSRFLILEPTVEKLNKNFLSADSLLKGLFFTARTVQESTIYTHTTHKRCFIQETVEHRIIRSRHAPLITEIKDEPIKSPLRSPTRLVKSPMKSPPGIPSQNFEKATMCGIHLQPEFPHVSKPSIIMECQATEMPRFLYDLPPKVSCPVRKIYCESREAAWEAKRFEQCDSKDGWKLVDRAFDSAIPVSGWSNVVIPDKQTLVSDAGKLAVLDSLLTRLKSQGHRVLIYSQMTKMIDLLEEYMWHRKHRYMRLDGSSKIAARRDMVADFQSRADIFVFLLSTRAGGLGINLTAADTVSNLILIRYLKISETFFGLIRYLKPYFTRKYVQKNFNESYMYPSLITRNILTKKTKRWNLSQSFFLNKNLQRVEKNEKRKKIKLSPKSNVYSR